jgi:hypothetical protein
MVRYSLTQQVYVQHSGDVRKNYFTYAIISIRHLINEYKGMNYPKWAKIFYTPTATPYWPPVQVFNAPNGFFPIIIEP